MDVPVTARDASGEDHVTPAGDAGRVDGGRPDASRPDGGRPDAAVPDGGRPDAAFPDGGRPDAALPDAGRVDAGRPDAGRPDASVPDAGPVCDPQDAFEPNNSRNNAAQFPMGGAAQGAVCGTDEDWFDVRVRPMDQVIFSVVPESAGPLSVEVQDRNGGLLATAMQDSTGAYVAVVTSPGRMALRVASSSGNTVRYRATFLVGGVMCTEDAFEPNDAQSNARVANGTVNGVICPGNVDFFAVDAMGANARVTVDVVPGPGSGDIDIILRDPAGNEVGRSERPNGAESIVVTTAGPGRYAVEIYGWPQSGPNASQGSYTLTMTATGGQSCVNDFAEPNDDFNDPIPELLVGQPQGLVLCPMDVDLFVVVPPADGSLAVTARGGPLQLQVFDQTGVLLATVSSNGPGGFAQALLMAAANQPFLVQVGASSPPATGTSYELFAEFSGATCNGQDAFEPNNSGAQAQPYTPPQSAGVTCNGDEDWFFLSGTPGDTVTVVVGTTGFLNVLEIWDATNSNILASGQPVPGGIGALVTDPSGRLWVRITSSDPGPTSYVLTANRSNPNMCVADNFEPNESPQTARPYGGPVQAQICANDRDFFSVVVQPGPGGSATSLRVQLFPFPDTGNLDVRVRGPNGTQVGLGNTLGNAPEFLDLAVTVAGTYTVEVFGAPEGRPNAGQGSYFMQVDVVTQNPNCPDDGFEDNDDFGNSTQLGDQADVSARFCNGDPDFYVVFTNTFGDATVTLSYVAPPRLRVTVFNSSGQQVADGNTGSGLEQLFLPGLAPDAYFVRVQGPNGAADGRDYQLTWSSAGQQCMGDFGEPNNDTSSATPINVPSLASAVMCGVEDVDVYGLNPTPGRGLRVVLSANMRPDGPLDAVLLGPDGFTQLASTFGQMGPTKTLAADISQFGTHFVQVFNSFGDPSPIAYSLNTSETAMLCMDDMFEENDGPLAARLQTVNTTVTATACNEDQDWFAYDLVRGNTVTISLNTMTGAEDFILLIAPNGGDLVGQGSTFQPIVTTITATGRYFVLPFFQTPSPTGIPYNITVRR